ncbi:MAG: TetR/AcrR family transcriptional regulator [Rhodospirillaceae bacterium]|nr:TetR/AcrR family transcriptional regulator [Rhodospirillaceae bacterium]MBT4687965.1 TetR/AcrR family transcriptional regulator [Rhodospirillaceae bacterium]MBT5526378.1 TetR/AcrR family transcriptional regulator [Rhodospirillaceae bacterium]MBT5881330.1 TetR/AcrR family transcriptional regulator [Rhodospirillaceae bacterium]MBT6590528.1 TetR/AcrR family transcriptional regulator [Rhodospirillaceae bacterium]
MIKIPDSTTIEHLNEGKRQAKNKDARLTLMMAAEHCLQHDGYAALSTRRVAERAEMPLSQIHYHFGSKQGLLLALYEYLNASLLDRQKAMFESDLPLSEQWNLACDYLDEDVASGYVRVLQELTAAGWSDPAIAAAIRLNSQGWIDLLTDVARRWAANQTNISPFTPEGLANLVGSLFLGVESRLLSQDSQKETILRSLRDVGSLIKTFEDANK